MSARTGDGPGRGPRGSRTRGRRLLGRVRRGQVRAGAGERETTVFGHEDPPPPPERAQGRANWNHTETPGAPPERKGTERAAPLTAQLLGLLADPRVEGITVASAARTLDRPSQDVETALETMVQAGRVVATDTSPRRYGVSAAQKQRLEALFRASARELGERGVLATTSPDDALMMPDDAAEEPRLPVTAGLLSLFLPGTGQLLNGDVGRASLVFAVWSLAWITHLQPVWTFVCLYAGAEAFFTAKIRSMERRLAQEAAARGEGGPPTPPALPPPKPSST